MESCMCCQVACRGYSIGRLRRPHQSAPKNRMLKRRPGRGTSPGRKRYLYSGSSDKVDPGEVRARGVSATYIPALRQARATYFYLTKKASRKRIHAGKRAHPPTPVALYRTQQPYMDGATLTAVPASAGSRKLGTALCPMGRGCGAVQCGGG